MMLSAAANPSSETSLLSSPLSSSSPLPRLAPSPTSSFTLLPSPLFPTTQQGKSLIFLHRVENAREQKNYRGTHSLSNKLKGKKKKKKKKKKKREGKKRNYNLTFNQSFKSSPIRSHSHTLHSVRVPRIEPSQVVYLSLNKTSKGTAQQKRNARHSLLLT
ncbi:hypothetical protein B9Z19DRAFT_336249 [Tuber borchii]|uniref:Uncharacterized protein n=1 Tax=Tuber borchii TaxID=42251 RepID=A0A2T6ZJE7_TUBBO|nr:hypothetical protein B9Z19DRAFT_336249 [Tuber borchii]